MPPKLVICIDTNIRFNLDHSWSVNINHISRQNVQTIETNITNPRSNNYKKLLKLI